MLRPVSEPTHVFGNASTTVIPIVAALTSPSRTIAVYKLLLTASAATNVTIQDSSGAALSQTIPLTGSKALVLDQLDDNDPWFITAAGLGVQIAQSGTANIGFDAYYLGGPFYTPAPSGAHVPVLVPTTWNPADENAITLSGGNLTAAVTAGSAGVRTLSGLSNGKYYFEVITTTITGACFLGLKDGAAISVNTDMIASNAAGTIFLAGTTTGIVLGTPLGGVVLCVAADVTNSLIWFRIGASGSWNAASGTVNNPATGVGGISFSSLTKPMFPAWTSSSVGDQITANFGASAFTGAVPAGFTAGWGVLQ